MRIVVQKVSQASVMIDADENQPETLEFNNLAEDERSINHGFVLLVGVEDADTDADVAWATKKIAHMRIFEDNLGKMNRSILDVHGSILSISQFTVYANVKRGNRPSFTEAGSPEHAEKLWKQFNATLTKEYGIDVKTGIFASHMHVSLNNDGPVTIIVDSAIMRG